MYGRCYPDLGLQFKAVVAATDWLLCVTIIIELHFIFNPAFLFPTNVQKPEKLFFANWRSVYLFCDAKEPLCCLLVISKFL